MAFKFFRIKDANDDNARLQAEVERLTKERDDAVANADAISAQPEALANELAAEKQKVANLTLERDAAVNALRLAESIHASAKAKLCAAHEIELAEARNPSAQALAIVSAVGVPNPIPQSVTSSTPASTKKDYSNLTGLAKAIAIHKDETASKN